MLRNSLIITVIALLFGSSSFGQSGIPVIIDDVYLTGGDLVDAIRDAGESDSLAVKFESNGKFYPTDEYNAVIETYSDWQILLKHYFGTLFSSLDSDCDGAVWSRFTAHETSVEGLYEFTNYSKTLKYSTMFVNYEWDFDDDFVSIEYEPVHFFSEDGAYDVCLTVTGYDPTGEVEHTSCRTVYVGEEPAAPGFAELPEEDLITSMSIYPNPATDYTNLNFRMSEDTELEVHVYDVLGQEVMYMNEFLVQGETNLELETKDLAAGSYLVTVKAGALDKTIKLTVR